MRAFGYSVLILAQVLLTGCLLSPLDNQTVTRDEGIVFQGYTPTRMQDVKLEGFVWELGGWETITTAKASGDVAASEGDTNWYLFDKRVPLPHGAYWWRLAASSGSQRRIYADMRGAQLHDQHYFASFDVNATQCLRDNPGWAAMQVCASPRSPVARVFAKCGKLGQTCCHTNQLPLNQWCDVGTQCDRDYVGATQKCIVGGGEGQRCFSDGTCRTGFACLWSPTASDRRCESLKGKVTTAFGGVDNRCAANDVVSTLLDTPLYSSPTTQVSYASREETRLPPDNIAFPDLDPYSDHVQGIGRIPNSANNRIMALTISNSDDTRKGGMFFVDVGQRSGNSGGLFLGGKSDDKTRNRNIAFYEMNTDHPGGMQVMGKIAVTVGVDNTRKTPFAWFFDVSDPVNKSAFSALIQKVDLNALGSPVSASASAVALTRLQSGRLLMLVHGKSTGTTREVWFYLSDQTTLTSSTTWRFHNYHSFPSHGAENINFVTQCNGNVYALLASNDSTNVNENGTQNRITPYRLAQASDGKLMLQSTSTTSSTTAYGFLNQGYCNFRAAANAYVTPMGELVIYCASRDIPGEDGNFKFAEWPEPAW